MRRVIIESPYAGNVELNQAQRFLELRYLRACIRDSLLRGEAPFASHAIYTQPGVLDDPEQRRLGIEAGFAWWSAVDRIVFCTDLGWSKGMKAAHERVHLLGIGCPQVVERTLGGEWSRGA